MNPSAIVTRASDLHWPVTAVVGPPVPGRVQLWCGLLHCEPTVLAEISRLLAPDEIQRASQFRTETLRQRFVTSRGVLRTILGKCLDVAPEQVRFETDAKGKPRLVESAGVEFNLAHSADLLLLAVTRGVTVGVDVERIRRLNNSQAIARRFFTKREADWLQDRTDGQLDRAFFDLWTRKEAVLKATGEGISGGLASLELLRPDGSFNDTVVSEPRGSPAGDWAVYELEPALGFVGALALPGSAGPIALQKASVPSA